MVPFSPVYIISLLLLMLTIIQEFVSGFYQGVTGIVTQPYSEAKRSGSAGFFKGIGKGIGGVILKPAAGEWLTIFSQETTIDSD